MSSIVKYLIVLLLFPSYIYAQESSLQLSEIMAKPEDDLEWVEIYNPTSQTISLDGWKVRDGNTQTSDDLTLSGSIDPQSYKTFERSKGWLNDSGEETVSLVQGSNAVDSYTYKNPTSGKTFSRISESWVANTDASKESANIAPLPSPSSSPSPSPSFSTSPTPSTENITNIFVVSDIPKEIFSDQEITVSIQLTISNLVNSTFYLKPAFKKVDSSNYFGLTKVGEEWVKNSESYAKQFKITIDSQGKWGGNLTLKVDPQDSGYSGDGSYLIKVARYSQDGNGPIWSNEQTLDIHAKEIESVDLTEIEIFPEPTLKYSPPPIEDLAEIEIPEEVYSLETYQRRIATRTGVASVSGVAKENTNYQLSYKKTEYLPIFIGGTFIAVGLAIYFRIKLNNEKDHDKFI